MKKYVILGCLFACAWTLSTKTHAYILGFKSRDNTIGNIQSIEENYPIQLSMVSFIFDPRGEHVVQTLQSLPNTLGTERIYHISLSPNNLSAQQVAEGKFDAQYQKFFALVKSGDLKVIFRTMHEMNGGRYPRSSNPASFKKARIHVRNLSRKLGLTQKNILFDMSLNARDLPAKNAKPSQTATFIQCQQKVKTKLKCPTFEDYYPGDIYVDLLGVTFYNRGKGNSTRRRGTPRDIINAPGWATLDRMKKFKKPLFIDEVGTTAVDYPGAYSYKKSLEVYANNKDLKNQRLVQLRDFLLQEPDIVGVNYFNVDLTSGLRFWTLGELDRSVIDFQSNKFYEGIMDVYKSAEKIEKNTSNLLSVFNLQYLSIGGTQLLVPSEYRKPLQDIYKTFSGTQLTLQKIKEFQESKYITKTYKRFSATDESEIIRLLTKIYDRQMERKRK